WSSTCVACSCFFVTEPATTMIYTLSLHDALPILGEDANTLEEVYEPFLIQNGLLLRTPRGRVATPRAYERFGYELPPARRAELRSEEHTSELQSRENLVCRLLLEKKKHNENPDVD